MFGLKFICFIKEIDQKDLAEKMEVSRQTITDWIKGKSQVKEKYLDEMEKILGVSKNLLFKQLNKDEMIEIINTLK